MNKHSIEYIQSEKTGNLLAEKNTRIAELEQTIKDILVLADEAVNEEGLNQPATHFFLIGIKCKNALGLRKAAKA